MTRTRLIFIPLFFWIQNFCSNHEWFATARFPPHLFAWMCVVGRPHLHKLLNSSVWLLPRRRNWQKVSAESSKSCSVVCWSVIIKHQNVVFLPLNFWKCCIILCQSIVIVCSEAKACLLVTSAEWIGAAMMCFRLLAVLSFYSFFLLTVQEQDTKGTQSLYDKYGKFLLVTKVLL